LAGGCSVPNSVLTTAWQISTFADLELPRTSTGPFPPAYPLVKWLTGAVFRASFTDSTLNERLMKVTTMMAHPSTLARPSALLRAVGVSLLRAIRRPRPEPAAA
jgi:hypothetical protein